MLISLPTRWGGKRFGAAPQPVYPASHGVLLMGSLAEMEQRVLSEAGLVAIHPTSTLLSGSQG